MAGVERAVVWRGVPAAIDRDDARLGRATAGDVLAVASASFRYAGRQGLMAHDPTRFLVAPTRERVKDLVTVTPDVARAALEAAAGTPVDVGVHLALGGLTTLI
jgi:hypothetical protein